MTQIRAYLTFCLHFNLKDINPDCDTICMFVEFLTRSIKSPQTIKNYISGVRMLHKKLDIKTTSLDSFELQLMLRAVSINLDHIPATHTLITVQILHRIADYCNKYEGVGVVMKCCFLFAYFAFLRVSNLAPMSSRQFNAKKNTCRGDMLLNPPGLIVVLKWQKTNQTHENIHLIPMPEIAASPLCPVKAYKDMLTLVPTKHPNDPLLMFPNTRKMVTTTWITKFVSNMCKHLRLEILGMHDFRRSGAEMCFRAGVDFTHIRKHGTWSSDAFFAYISKEAIAETSPIPGTLKQLVSN